MAMMMSQLSVCAFLHNPLGLYFSSECILEMLTWNDMRTQCLLHQLQHAYISFLGAGLLARSVSSSNDVQRFASLPFDVFIGERSKRS